MYASEADFRGALDAITGLLEAGATRSLVGPRTTGRGIVRFEVLGYHRRVQELLRESEMTLARFQSAADDIGDVLSALARRDDREAFVSFRSDASEESVGGPENRELAELKYDLVAGQFDIGDLRRRVWLKHTTNTKMFFGVAWEVGLRTTDDALPSPDGRPVPYATLRLSGAEGSSAPYLLPEFGELILTVDREDAAFLRDHFDRLLTELDRQSEAIPPPTTETPPESP